MAIDFDKVLYDEAVHGMNDKARYKLKNFMAHGYEIQPTVHVTVIIRNNSTIMIDKNGDMWKAVKAI